MLFGTLVRPALVSLVLLALVAAGCASTSSGGDGGSTAADNSSATTDEPSTPAPEWAGEWVQKETPFLAMTLAADSFEKRTYNTEAREEMFTGSRGSASLDGDQLTLVKTESWSKSMKWYGSQETTETWTLSMADGELTLTNEKGDAVVYVRP